jgi:hypothetical protein
VAPVKKSAESPSNRRGFIKGIAAGLVGAFFAVRGTGTAEALPHSSSPMPRLNLPPFVVPSVNRPLSPSGIGPTATGPPPFYTREIREWHKLVARSVRQRRGTIGTYEVRLDLSERNQYDHADDPYVPVIQWTIVTVATASNGETVVQSYFTGGQWYFPEQRFSTITMEY